LAQLDSEIAHFQEQNKKLTAMQADLEAHYSRVNTQLELKELEMKDFELAKTAFEKQKEALDRDRA
jgi:Skp family chaperone for outer membrane proteins